MNDSIPNHPDTQIDTRPLLASGALRGSLGGFCWSLLVAIPVAVVYSTDPKVGPFWAIVALGGICSIWSAVAAFAEKRRTRERTYTEEQRAVLRRHLRTTRIQALCASLVLIGLTESIRGGDGPVFKPRHACGMIILSIAISSDLVGRAKGTAAVRAMQQEARNAFCRMDAHPPTVVVGTPPSTLVRPSMERFAEPGHRQAEATADGRLDD